MRSISRREPGRYTSFVLALTSALMLACGDSGTHGTSSTDTTGGDETGGDPLDRCRALPAAETSQWSEDVSADTPTGMSTPARIATAGDQSWALALDLLRVMSPSDHPSIAQSPMAMTLAFGLTIERHAGSMCADSMEAVIHAQETDDALHNTLGASLRELQGRALPEGPEGESPVNFDVATSLWEFGAPAQGNPIYGVAAHSFPRESSLSAKREVINCVIEEQSRGLIVDFLPEDVPAIGTTALDVSVAYLGAPWETALSPRPAAPFTRDDGGAVDHEMMGELLSVGRYSSAEMEAVDIPLRGGALSMLLVLPAPELYADLEAFVAGVSPEALRAARSGAVTSVDLTIPKFEVTGGETIDYYKPLGLQCELFSLRKVLHRAVITVDEKGVEAAAASANESWETDGGPGGLPFTVDRPFLFFVHDRATGFVLFSGRYAGS